MNANKKLAELSASLPLGPGAPKIVPKTEIPKYEFHPLANAFPLDEVGIPELGDSIKQNGQHEDIVLATDDADGQEKIADGRRRYLGCQHVGAMPRFRKFNPEPDGSLAQFVTDLNLKRRHLNAGQKAAAAVELIPFFEAEAAELAKAGGTNGESEDGTTVDKSGDFDQTAGKRGRKSTGGRATKKAAKATGASQRSVEKAKGLKKKNPKAFKEVAAGKKTLGRAVSDEDYKGAIERIEEICGKSLAKAVRDGTRLKSKQEVIKFAKLRAGKMRDIQGLIEAGDWKVDAAVNYKEKNLNATHKISDLLARATKEGGEYECTIDEFTISVKRKKVKKSDS